MEQLDKNDKNIVRNFYLQINKLKPEELTEYLNCEKYLEIKGFSKEEHLGLIMEVIQQEYGFDLDNLSKSDLDIYNEKPETKHKIAIVLTEPSLQLVYKKILRISFEETKTIENTIKNYLEKNKLSDYVIQSNRVIETISGKTHFVDHFYYVFIEDHNKLESFLKIEVDKKEDKNIWLQHVSNLNVLSFDKNYIKKLKEKRNNII